MNLIAIFRWCNISSRSTQNQIKQIAQAICIGYNDRRHQEKVYQRNDNQWLVKGHKPLRYLPMTIINSLNSAWELGHLEIIKIYTNKQLSCRHFEYGVEYKYLKHLRLLHLKSSISIWTWFLQLNCLKY